MKQWPEEDKVQDEMEAELRAWIKEYPAIMVIVPSSETIETLQKLLKENKELRTENERLKSISLHERELPTIEEMNGLVEDMTKGKTLKELKEYMNEIRGKS